MKKLMLGFAALAAGSVMAIESANIVGYQNVNIPSGYSIFTATFKNVSAASIDLTTIVPKTPAGADITGDNKVQVFTLDTDGNYGETIIWCPKTAGGWSADSGETKIAEGKVTIANGQGFAVYNNLKVNGSGVEATKNATSSPSVFVVSGEVDLVCANTVPSGYSVNGNSTPVAIDLNQIVPQTPAGVDISGDNKVQVFTLGTDGNYGETIIWCPKTAGGWSADSGATKIADGEVVFEPGVGFAVYNNLKVNASGVEATKNANASPAVLKLPSPIK